jgi:ribonuclease HI
MSYYVGIQLRPTEIASHLISNDWTTCKEFVEGMPGAFSKKFESEFEAIEYRMKFCYHWASWLDIVNSNAYPTVYVDGGCKLKPKMASWGIHVRNTVDEFVFENYGIVGDDKSPISIPPKDYLPSRQIPGELYAAYKAIEWARDNDQQIILALDYLGIMYTALGIWKSNNPIQKWYYENTRDWSKYVKAWRWTPGHTGILGNERADSLAALAIKEHTYE